MNQRAEGWFKHITDMELSVSQFYRMTMTMKPIEQND